MTMYGVFGTTARRSIFTALLLFVTVIVTACGSTAAAPSAVSAPTAAPKGAAAANVALSAAPQAAAPATPAAGAAPSKAVAPTNSSNQCQLIGDAYFDFQGNLPYIVALTSDASYVANTPDSPAYVNIPKLLSDLDVLSNLPATTEFGKTTDAIAQFRQGLDLADSNIKSGKPFGDGSGNGQKLIDFYGTLVKPFTILAAGFGTMCPHYVASTPTPDSAAASHAVGQTAPLGDLRVTLDKVTTTVGSGINLAPAGKKFVTVYVTVGNGGTVGESLMVLGSSMKDAAGTQYFFDPFAGMAGGVDLTSQIPAGGKASGSIVYVLPTNSGDLLWIVEDYGHNRAVFGIKAGEIVAEGPALSPADEAALRASAAATQTAFAELINTAVSADATQTATTPEPSDTPAPEDTSQVDATPTAGN